MESTEERRGSFLQFVVTPAPHDVAKADKADATTAWERLTHSTNLLGYGLLVSFATVIFAAWLSGLEWTKEGRDDGVPRLENGAVLTGIVMPISVFWVAFTCFHVYQATAYSDAGPHVVKVPFGLGVILVSVFYGIHAAILSADIDSKYSSLEACRHEHVHRRTREHWHPIDAPLPLSSPLTLAPPVGELAWSPERPCFCRDRRSLQWHSSRAALRQPHRQWRGSGEGRTRGARTETA